MEGLKGVLVGCGFFGAIQLEAWSRMDQAEIVALCDVDQSRAEGLAREHGISDNYSDYLEMLDSARPDFVDIATRPEAHLWMVEQAARRGLPILCQKPMAPTLEEAEAMVRICREHGVRLMVNENWRWQPWYREIKRLLTSGGMPPPSAVYFRHRGCDGWAETPYPAQPYFAKMPRLLVYETLVHYLDTCRYLFSEPESLYCRTRKISPHIKGEDCAIIHLEFSSGPRIIIDGNRCTPLGQEGPVLGNVIFESGGKGLELQPDGRIYIESCGGLREEHRYTIPRTGYRGDSCKATQAHFIDCLTSGNPFETEGDDYLKTFDLVFDAYRSARTGQVVQKRPRSGKGSSSNRHRKGR